ncbi:LOW QUALITY PROTEIN: hypothetical protein PHMEG_00040008 [Phytophthora megakarya]|uniref:Ubiquitin-like protease family profile domain-containing protein n=1 Tax=Phytophthora megakarya TaxID=4795 RepID=A0A225UET1_9STRA|nr:LOW QUALITY PROTEIN: hypothetical protein PHMEG_00040008 [Phytophthora megakarya]
MPVCEISQQAGVRVMEEGEQVTLHAEANLAIEAVEHTTEWINGVSWTGLQLNQVPEVIHGLGMAQKAAIILEVKNLNLCLAAAAIHAYRLLSFRHHQWLRTTAMLACMHALAMKYGDLVYASFTAPTGPDQKRQVANVYKAFSPVKKNIIGVLNVYGSHWITFHIDVTSRACRRFDHLQSEKAYTNLKSTLQEIVEAVADGHRVHILPDNGNCGLWCLVVLDLTTQSVPWTKTLY